LVKNNRIRGIAHNRAAYASPLKRLGLPYAGCAHRTLRQYRQPDG
jgi:hypothetical protein